MATTEAAVLDRIRTVCVDAGLTEAVGVDFLLQPNDIVDDSFTASWAADAPLGGFGFTEEARGVALIGIAKLVNDDLSAAKGAALTTARTVIAAVVRDGAQTSGEYAVDDSGRSITIETPVRSNFLIARVRVPINFEAAL